MKLDLDTGLWTHCEIPPAPGSATPIAWDIKVDDAGRVHVLERSRLHLYLMSLGQNCSWTVTEIGRQDVLMGQSTLVIDEARVPHVCVDDGVALRDWTPSGSSTILLDPGALYDCYLGRDHDGTMWGVARKVRVGIPDLVNGGEMIVDPIELIVFEKTADGGWKTTSNPAETHLNATADGGIGIISTPAGDRFIGRLWKYADDEVSGYVPIYQRVDPDGRLVGRWIPSRDGGSVSELTTSPPTVLLPIVCSYALDWPTTFRNPCGFEIGAFPSWL